MPPSDVLHKIRTRIVEKPKKWQAVIEDQGILENFDGISGTALIRPPRGFDPDASHMADLKRKSFFTMKRIGDSDIVANANFVAEVIKTFEAMTPLMHFISDAVEVEF